MPLESCWARAFRSFSPAALTVCALEWRRVASLCWSRTRGAAVKRAARFDPDRGRFTYDSEKVMNDAIIVLNAGSSSLKFSLYQISGDELTVVARGQYEALDT